MKRNNQNIAGFKIIPFVCRTDKSYEFDIPEQTGNNLQDAVYYRNLAVEERYGVKIAPYQVDGNWGSRQTFIDTIRNEATAGDGYIDLIAGYCAYMPTVVLNGYCMNLYKLRSLISTMTGGMTASTKICRSIKSCIWVLETHR